MSEKTPLFRGKKLHSLCAVGQSGSHTWRTMRVDHADPARTHLNQDWLDVASPAQLRDAVKRRLEAVATVPRNAVLVIEYIVTTAADNVAAGVAWEPFFRDALAWLEERHGKENVLAANVQLDEESPHLVVYAMPVVHRPARTRTRNVIVGRSEEGKILRGDRTFEEPARLELSASTFLGNRHSLSELQTRFHQEVASRHGFQRGLEGSASRHVRPRDYQSALRRAFNDHLEIDPESLAPKKIGFMAKESAEQVAERYAQVVHDHYAPVVARAALADQHQKRAQEERETAFRHRAAREKAEAELAKVRARLEIFTKGLSKAQVAKFEEVAEKWRRQNAEAIRAKRERDAQAARGAKREAAERLARMRPGDLLKADAEWRRRAWPILSDPESKELVPLLVPLLDAVLDTGWFHPDGSLTEEGREALQGEGEPRRRPEALAKPSAPPPKGFDGPAPVR